MSNQVARSFLNDESIVKLENSVGVRDGIAVKKRIDKLDMQIIECEMKLMLLQGLISDKNKELINLRQAGVFAKLFNRKKLKARIEELQAKIKEFKEDIESTRERLCELEREQDRRRRELSQFETVIGRVGLRLEDIEDEYYQIKHDFQQKEQGVKLQVVESSMSSDEKPRNARLSQIEKFESRLKKYETMKKSSEETQNQQGAPSNE